VFDPARMWTGAVGDVSLWACLAMYFVVAVWVERLGREGEARPGFAMGVAWGLRVALLLLALCLAPSEQAAPFIYFQF
jgi:hypothetical protein